MSEDRTTEILNYLSAISRDVGALRTEMREPRSALSALQSEVREIAQRMARTETTARQTRAHVRDTEDRMTALESKQPLEERQ